MATITIKSIGRQHILSTEAFAYLIQNLGKPLALSSIDFDRDGNLQYIVVYGNGPVIVLFSDNEVEFEVNLPCLQKL